LLRGQKIKEVCKEYRDKSSTGDSDGSSVRLDIKPPLTRKQSSLVNEVEQRPSPPSGPSRRPGPPPIPGS
jgi:hypothetical protein